jgi:hypothetical protein
MASLDKQAARRQRAKNVRKKSSASQPSVGDRSRTEQTKNASPLQSARISTSADIRKALIYSVDQGDRSSFSQTLTLATSLNIEPFSIRFSAVSGAADETIAEMVLSREKPDLFDALLDWVFIRSVVDQAPMALTLDALCDRVELCEIGPTDRVYEVAAFQKITRFTLSQGLTVEGIISRGYSAALHAHFLAEAHSLIEMRKIGEAARAPAITAQSKRL